MGHWGLGLGLVLNIDKGIERVLTQAGPFPRAASHTQTRTLRLPLQWTVRNSFPLLTRETISVNRKALASACHLHYQQK